MHAGSHEMAAGFSCVLACRPEKGTYAWDRIPEGSDCFMLYVMDLYLPWVLEEPLDEVVSPANEPSFLRRALDKLPRRQPKDSR